MELSIVLPCFNEEGNIAQTVGAVHAWMRERKIGGEIIVVDDGSRDKTGVILEKMQNGSSPQPSPDGRGGQSIPLRLITHLRNLGYGAAVRSGCDAATIDLIAFMDSDGQFDPKDFDRLWPHLRGGPSPLPSPSGRGGYDVVVGRRRRRADPFLRKLNAKLFGILSWAMLGIWVRDMNCAMKVFRRSIWERARPVVTTGALFNAELFYNLKRAGIPWHQVDVSHYPRRAGRQTGANPKVILRVLRELWQLRGRR
ncbi:glycosyltransferase family 2 protein [Candidatus Peregrinibacteria bacterium]|nr:glycosyltransferase family 2 protein [Candidatus Peregrinibacteria bacterium]